MSLVFSALRLFLILQEAETLLIEYYSPASLVFSGVKPDFFSVCIFFFGVEGV